MTAFPVLLNYEPAYYLFESFPAANKATGLVAEETFTSFAGKAFVGKKIYYMPNVRTRKNGDVDGAFFDVAVEDKKWKADELVREVLRRGGKIVLVSIKNWAIWIWFSLNKFYNLIAELQHADLEHKAKWLLIIPKLRASQKVRRLLTANKIEVIETGEQITLDEKQSQRAQVQWLNILNEKLKPQLYKIFGLLFYRMYNYTIYRNISNLSYLQLVSSSSNKVSNSELENYHLSHSFIRFISHSLLFLFQPSESF
ncbi:MAG: hypothetical protein ABSB71_05085 [Candidatus Bathyarchaeia archaeon]|jgi:hypothetical protein